MRNMIRFRIKVKTDILMITPRSSVADPDPSLFAVLRIRIRDPGLGAFLTPGYGIRDGRKPASGSGIRDEQPGSYFLELRNIFLLFWG